MRHCEGDEINRKLQQNGCLISRLFLCLIVVRPLLELAEANGIYNVMLKEKSMQVLIVDQVS